MTENILEMLKEGVVINGPFWPENIKIFLVKPYGSRIQIIGSGMISEKSYSSIHEISDLSNKITIISGVKGSNFTADSSKFRLALESKRIKMSYEFDPLFAVGVSKIDPLPHQIEAVYDYLLKRPRIRFLLADDPGAGKTIMAGLLLKELKYRKTIENVLIVVPPNLMGNWKEELYEKFGELLIEVNRERMNSLVSGLNIWEQGKQFIISMDFAKQPDIIETLRTTHWDLVIVDEAHKFSAYQFGEKTEKSGRYHLGEILSETSEHLLFLTATPHKGDPDNFLLLLNLLDQNLYSNTTLLKEAIQKNENPIMLRRLKESMINDEGKPIFPPRKVHTIPFELTPPEKNLYDAVTEYLTKNFERAEKSKQKNAVGFAMFVLQRRLASSIRAIRKSLERRRDKLKDRLIYGTNYQDDLKGKDLTLEEIEEMDDLPEDKLWDRENALISLSTAENKEELEMEIKEIQKLVEIAIEVENIGTEKKLNEVKHVLFDVEEIRNTNEKLLIFSEHKDTTDYLIEKVQQWGFSVCHIDGTMNMEQRKVAMTDFAGDTQVMVATEAAGEGINLQFCSLMINYDIPWNPTRLEQRMGRIHRYKQKKEVHVYNMIASNTLEGRVLEVLFAKLERMREHLGSDRVYDVIDKLLEEENIRLDRLIREAVKNRVTFEEFCTRFQKNVSEEDIEKLKKATEEALAVRQVDLSKYRDKVQTAEEQRLLPEYIEKFFVESFRDVGGVIIELEKNSGIWRIENVPIEVRKILSEHSKMIKRYYGKISFNKEIVKKTSECEFVAPGSILFDSVIELIMQKYSILLQEGAIFVDPSATKPELLWFMIGKISDGKGRKIGERMFAITEDENGIFVKRGPFMLWDLNPSSKDITFNSFVDDIQNEKEKTSVWTLENLIDPFFEEILKQRLRELSIREKYVSKSLDYLIRESITKLGKLREKESKGKDMRIAIQNENRRQEEYVYRKQKSLEEIEQEKNLSPSMPEVIATAAIIPLKETVEGFSLDMKRDDEIEKIAMEVSRKYEESQGRKPEDISKDDLGYDIKSKGKDELRYIEVKGRAVTAKIILTPNEWIKAKRFGKKFWLYVVANCATMPELYLIQDPASKIKPDEVILVSRFIVNVEQWKSNSTKVN